MWAQLEEADQVTGRRLDSWAHYHALLLPLEARGLVRRPIVPEGCRHNAHMYYALVDSLEQRQHVLDAFRQHEIGAVFHYVPLHSAPAGRRYGRTHGSLAVTESLADRLTRLPLWFGISESEQERVVGVLGKAVS